MMSEAEQQGRFRFFIQIEAAVAAVVLAIKLGKIVLNYGVPALLRENRPEILKAESNAVVHSALLHLVVVVALTYLIARYSFPRLKLLAVLAPAPGFLLYKVCQSFVVGTSVATLLSGSGTLRSLASEVQYLGSAVRPLVVLLPSVLWRDLAFLSGFTLIVYLLIHYTPARFFNIVRAGLLVMIFLMFAIAGVELANYLQTGVAGSGQLLAYFFLNSGRGDEDWWSMLTAHIDGITLLALCAPFLLGITAAFWSGRSIPTKPKTSRVRTAVLIPVTLGILLITSIYQPALSNVRYARQVDNTFLALRDAFPSSHVVAVEAMRQAAALPPLFDTSSAMLGRASQGRPPARNVIVIIMESAQAKSTTIYNPALPTTPFLADLAKRGAVVSDMYAVIPRTSAAWMAILYGIYPSTNDLNDRWPTVPGGQERFRSLPRLLEGQGYKTGFITTTHANFDHEQNLIQGMGFQWVETGKTLPTHGLKEVNYDGFEDSLMVDPALNWIGNQSAAGHPFFLTMMTNVGHDPYAFPASWKKRSFGTGLDPRYENYLNCMAYIDSVLQDFFRGLDRLGVLKSSLILIMGDHGEAFAEARPRQHIMVPYEEALKIPMIIYADGLIRPGTSITGLRQEPDIMPTVLDALGLQGEHLIIPGTSELRPVSPDRKLYYSTSFFDGILALRTGATKFIYNFDRTPLEVYDIGQDPEETHNIADKIPEDKRKEVVFDMLVWRERVRRELIMHHGTASAH